ncbi:MAG: hypothetical protein LBU26_04120 [Synergistaceae bacterium]|jgi:hypothetical protein|nr:hypothetical protein [Synergistaceae bacterium]
MKKRFFSVVLFVLLRICGAGELCEADELRVPSHKAYGVAVMGREILRIDENGNFIELSKEDFDGHPVWGGISDIKSDGQAMVKIPKCYIKRGEAPAGSDADGADCWWLSAEPLPGFKLAPAFLRFDGSEMDYFLLGKYEACFTDGGELLGSRGGKVSAVGLSWDEAKTKTSSRGAGWHIWDIQELAVIQYLALIELCSFDVQEKISQGPTQKPLTGTTNVVYRGIHGLWRHVWQLIDGIDSANARTIRLFSEDGKRRLMNTGIPYGNYKSYPKRFRRGGLFDSVFIADRVTPFIDDQSIDNFIGEALCPDGQFMWQAYPTAAYVCDDWGGGSFGGLWTIRLYDFSKTNAAGYDDIGTRIAKRCTADELFLRASK